MLGYQMRVYSWMLACFGIKGTFDRQERVHRFYEESTELAQACGQSREEAHQLVDYVYDRQTGIPREEAGDALITLTALCLAHDIPLNASGEEALARNWTKIDKIRAKQLVKPKVGPLPGKV